MSVRYLPQGYPPFWHCFCWPWQTEPRKSCQVTVMDLTFPSLVIKNAFRYSDIVFRAYTQTLIPLTGSLGLGSGNGLRCPRVRLQTYREHWIIPKCELFPGNNAPRNDSSYIHQWTCDVLLYSTTQGLLQALRPRLPYRCPVFPITLSPGTLTIPI